MFGLNQWAAHIHEWARGKGWWDDRNVVDPAPLETLGLLMLAVTELAESAEAVRERPEGVGLAEVWYDPEHPDKPEGLAIEMADTIIRILDTTHAYGIDIEAAVRIKMAYNQGRAHRHGGKKA